MTNSMKNNTRSRGPEDEGPELAYGGDWEEGGRKDLPGEVTCQLKKVTELN